MSVRLRHSLHFKIAAAVIITILSLSALYFVWDYRYYRSQLLMELMESTGNLTEVTLQGLLEVAMVGRHPELLQKAVERLGKNPAVAGIMFLDASGTVRFSSNPEDLNLRLSRSSDGCRDCHMPGQTERQPAVFFDLVGTSILRHAALVPNPPECHSCHDPAQEYNGLMIVDFPTAPVWSKLEANLEEKLIQAGVTVLAILGVLGLLLNKLVILRLKRLTQATGMLAGGEGRTDLQAGEGEDEIGQLGHSFNAMASRVRDSIHALQSQKTYLQDLMNSLEDSLIVVDRSLEVGLVNEAASQRWSQREMEEMFREEGPLPAVRQSVRECLEGGSPVQREATLETGEGLVSLEIQCSPMRNRKGESVGVIVVLRDTTERRLLERQISRAERLATVGELAAGVAHEINNPMAAITTCVEGLGRHLDTSPGLVEADRLEIKEYLSTIGEAAERCAEITRRLLSASADRGPVEFQQVDMGVVVNEVMALVEHQAAHRNTRITSDAKPGFALLMGDRKQLSQLTLNLILNSLEATDESGKIHIALARKNGLVELEISDNGCGIPRQNLDRIFDPFFTAKRSGTGTGLGLYICEGIVRHHQGQIYVHSEESKGTRFSILFPGASETEVT